jgi:4'-phosphopantetheinyl transferase EntD
MLFSAKEAVFKAWSPATGRWLGFTDAELELGLDGSFAARLLVAGPLTAYHGLWAVSRGVLATAVTAPAAASV